ncbi:hypothetical protein KIN20_000443 [Parelaphostrongylus tenuis]|uniref:Uncharacterized protein n=1 Tax=Parelaphostrongylus tenuis TaxID=148309 RepID=A0AAD5MKN1_PARTN|nr:hypothetical protein KIN20_000443 [Parelaphostrongylus tenuis]
MGPICIGDLIREYTPLRQDAMWLSLHINSLTRDNCYEFAVRLRSRSDSTIFTKRKSTNREANKVASLKEDEKTKLYSSNGDNKNNK